jgi:ubiquinone/menaquinone biosynthesis C-methylase UbiE
MTQTDLKTQPSDAQSRPAGAALTYPLGRGDAETRRLMLQHQIYGPITRRLFDAAGIGAGMRVLDIGSGAGDVSLLLADLVGPRGHVTGVDLNGEILQTARARVRAASWENVEFQAGDAANLPLDQEYDAIVGRWVLMHTADPVVLLRALAVRLRPGGIIAFQESDFSYPPAQFPSSELFERVREWGVPRVEQAAGGPRMQMGMRLYSTYLEAGLPAPELRLEAPIGGGADWPGYQYVAETLRSLMPFLERTTGLDPDDVQIDTLADRMRDDAVAGGRVQLLPIVIGAWARTVA